MKIRERDLKVLAVLDRDSSLSVNRISKIVGQKTHIVRDIIKKYQDKDLVKEEYIIDFSKIGLEEINVYFSLTDRVREKKELIFDYLSSREDVIKVSVTSGEFDFLVTFIKLDRALINQSLSEISKKFGDVFQTKVVTNPVSKKILSRDYLSSFSEREIITLKKSRSVYLDELDEGIISEILRDGSLKRRDLAARLSANEKTLSYRIQELKKKGVIRKKHFTPDLQMLGRFNLRLLISLKTQDQTFKKELEAFFEENLEVTKVSETLSYWDYEVSLELLRPENQMGFIDELYRKFPSRIAKVSSLGVIKEKEGNSVVIDTYKATLEYEEAA